jgi:hypothetical protein
MSEVLIQDREQADLEEFPDRPLFWEGLRMSFARVPVWLLTWVFLGVLALVAALPWYSFVEETAANRYEPGSLVAELSQAFRIDHADRLALLNDTTARVGAILALVAMLLGVFFAGGWLQIFVDRGEGFVIKRFFYGGSRFFWRFLRFFALTLVVLALASWTIYDLPWEQAVLAKGLQVPEADFETLETLASERNARYLLWAQDGLFALTIGLVFVWGVYARARMAVHDASSALWSGVCSFFLMLRHPFKTLTPMAILFVAQALVVVLALLGARLVERGLGAESSYGQILALFAVTSIFPLWWANVTRGARYYVAMRVIREISPATRGADRWQAAIGGPGGPRYPLEGDEYGVSI